jgi:hypothetical protein
LVYSYYYYYISGKPVIMWCVANQDKDHPFAMHQELIQQTHDIEGSLDYHVFGGANSRAPPPTEGRIVHVHHDMIWLNDAQFKALKYVAQHYFIHPRPGHPVVSEVPVVQDGPTEEELINFIAPTFEKATPEHFLMTGIVEESVAVESVAVESVDVELTVDESIVDGPQPSVTESVEVFTTKKGKKRHIADDF